MKHLTFILLGISLAGCAKTNSEKADPYRSKMKEFLDESRSLVKFIETETDLAQFTSEAGKSD